MLLLPVLLTAQNKAAEYNDFLICWQDQLEEAILLLGDEIEKGEQEKAYEELDSILTLIERAKGDIKLREPHNNEYLYQEAALEWWSFYKQIFTHDYPDILEISFKDDPAKKDFNRLKGYMKNLQVAEKFANHEFKIAQKKFALKYDLHLQ